LFEASQIREKQQEKGNINSQAKKISCRAGSLIVWSGELPHCNYPNESRNFRINQYVKMIPAQENGKNADLRRECVKSFTKDIEVTELGKKLLGLENWDGSDK